MTRIVVNLRLFQYNSNRDFVNTFGIYERFASNAKPTRLWRMGLYNQYL
jgi:hypothetical protein